MESKTRGVILIDILIAISLAGSFIIFLGAISQNARAVFVRAKARDDEMKGYTSNPALVSMKEKPYGNDFTEEEISLSTLKFTKIVGLNNTNNLSKRGTPVCSVDFTQSSSVGSLVTNKNFNIHIRPLNLPISPTIPLTDLEVRNGLAYISADSAVANDPDLYVVDVRSGNGPVVLSSVNTGPGIASISFFGNRVYAAAASTAAQMHIVRFDDPTRPILEKKYQLILPYATATPPFASSIFYDDGYVFLGTEKWDGKEFVVLNVQNPQSPVEMGAFETGSKINDIYEISNHAYISASDQMQLRVLNMADRANPFLVSHFSPTGWQRQEGKIISYFEDRLDFGRTSGGFDRAEDHEIFGFASTSSVTLGNYNSLNIKAGIYGILNDRSYIYAITRDINREFRIFSKEQGNDSNFSSSTSFSLPIVPQVLVCDQSSLYILSHSSPTLYEISFN